MTVRLGRVVRALGVAVLMASLARPARAEAPRPFLIHDGDTVVFVGDSITEHGLFITYLAEYFAVRWPAWRVELIDRGVFGGRAVDAVSRVQREVIPLRPQLVILFFGVNDARYQGFRENILADYKTALRKTLERLRAAGIAAALVTPTVIDPSEIKGYQGDPTEYNDVLGRYAQAVRELGRELAVPVLDVYGALRSALQQSKAAQPGFTMIPGGVHPSAPGHLIMAACMLRDLGAPPIVSEVVVDAGKGGAGSANGGRVRDLVVGDRAVAFTWQDEQWWWPLDWDARPILPWAAEVRGVDAVWLKVRGLPAGSYRVQVDGQTLESAFSAAQLESGLHVPAIAPALWPGPLTDLARQVAERQRVLRLRWDPIQLTLPDGPEKSEILTQMDRLLSRLRGELAPLQRPQPMRWSIFPQGRG